MLLLFPRLGSRLVHDGYCCLLSWIVKPAPETCKTKSMKNSILSNVSKLNEGTMQRKSGGAVMAKDDRSGDADFESPGFSKLV